METKFCKFCQCDHPLTDEWWYFHVSKEGWKSTVCKIKMKEKASEHYSENKERHYSLCRARIDEDPLANKEYMKEYRDNHKEELSESSRQRYNSDIENQRAIRKEWSRNNKEKKKEIDRLYQKKNKDKINNQKREKNKIRRHTDTNYKLSLTLRRRINLAIKRQQRAGSAVRDLGCTIPELKQHLESKFQIGMTWENWSVHGWHIDHIIPLASFDLTDRGQFLKACHYTNLQPLWAKDNLSKGSKVAIEQDNMVK